MHVMLRILHEMESKFLNSSRVFNHEIKCGLRVGFVLFMFQINVFMVCKKKEEMLRSNKRIYGVIHYLFDPNQKVLTFYSHSWFYYTFYGASSPFKQNLFGKMSIMWED